jgi:hypothetical protein
MVDLQLVRLQAYVDAQSDNKDDQVHLKQCSQDKSCHAGSHFENVYGFVFHILVRLKRIQWYQLWQLL